jgi:hypothetical protein
MCGFVDVLQSRWRQRSTNPLVQSRDTKTGAFAMKDRQGPFFASPQLEGLWAFRGEDSRARFAARRGNSTMQRKQLAIQQPEQPTSSRRNKRFSFLSSRSGTQQG